MSNNGIFANNNNQNQNKSIFGNQPNQPNAQGNSIFNNPNNGGNPAQNNPQQNNGGGIFANNNKAQTNSSPIFGANNNQQNQSNTNLFNKPFTNPNTNPFGVPAPQNSAGNLFPQQNNQNNQNPANSAPNSNQPAQNMFGNNQQAQGNNPPKPPGNIFGNNNTSNTSPNPFGNSNPNNSTNPPVQNTQAQQPVQQNTGAFGGNQGTNLLTGKPADQNNQQAPQGGNPPAQNPPINLFGNKNTAPNNSPTETNQAPNQQTGQQPGNQPATGAGGLFANKQTASTTVSPQQSANLFKNTPPTTGATGNQGTDQNQGTGNSPGGIFNNTTGNQNTGQQQNSTGQQQNPQGQQGQQNPQGQQGQQGQENTNIFNSVAQGGQQPGQQGGQQGVQNQQRKSPADIQFENNEKKSVKESVESSRKDLDSIYKDVLKLSNNMIQYQETREDCTKINKNFDSIKPEMTSSSQEYNRVLKYLSLGPEGSNHNSLVSCLKEMQELCAEVVGLQIENKTIGGEMKPSHEQMNVFYQTLNNLEMQVESMDHMLAVSTSQFKQRNGYGENYGNGYSQNGYGDMEYGQNGHGRFGRYWNA